MEVNTKWKDVCTEERMEKMEDARASFKESLERGSAIDTKMIFCNPVVAIKFGLFEVLKYLVEGKGIDVNDLKWTGILSLQKVHLAVAAGFAPYPDIPCLEYLLSVESIDLKTRKTAEENCSTFYWVLLSNGADHRCFESMVRHLSMNLNAGLSCVSSQILPLELLLLARVTALEEDESATFDNDAWRAKLQILLAAGADPSQRQHGRPLPISKAEWESQKKPQDRVWREAVELMERAAITR